MRLAFARGNREYLLIRDHVIVAYTMAESHSQARAYFADHYRAEYNQGAEVYVSAE